MFSKTSKLGRCLLLVVLFCCGGRGFGDSAPSLWSWPLNDNFSGDVIIRTVQIPYDTLETYYSSINWNAGMDGGGYCGLQAHPSGHNFIFSIWDPSNGEAITAAYQDPGTDVLAFGGEGTGLKSWNFQLGWLNGQWYSTATRCWDVGNHTYFGYWIHDITGEKWTHLVTMDFPMPSIRFSTSNGGFLEDWRGTGERIRRYHIKSSYKRSTAGSWAGMQQLRISANADTGGQYDWNFNGGIENDYYFVESGGTSTPGSAFGSGRSATFSIAKPTTPQNPAIAFSITQATTNTLSWDVPVSSTPQFSYTININGSEVASEIEPEANSVAIFANLGDSVELILEDILGRTTSHSGTIGEASVLIPQTSWTLHDVNSEETSGEDGAAVNAFDGNIATIWHTGWSASEPTHPHEIQINLGSSNNIDRLTYLPRQNGVNGTISDYEIYVSSDGINWGSPVAAGTWGNSPTEKQIFFSPVTGSYISLRALSEVNGGAWASAAEINVYAVPADTTPPAPNPMTFATAPVAISEASISMTATAASDPSGVEYYFTCTAGGGHDSSWQDSTTYADTGLIPSTQYSYTVVARDKSDNQNATNPSSGASATTDAPPPDNDSDGIPDATDPDDDNDGIPDAWEIAHSLNPFVDDKAGNPDLDGNDNWFEYVADTDPQDETSFQTFWVEPHPTIGVPVLYFSSSSNRTYAIEECADLLSGSWTNLIGQIQGTGSQKTFLRPLTGSARYYRLRIELP